MYRSVNMLMLDSQESLAGLYTCSKVTLTFLWEDYIRPKFILKAECFLKTLKTCLEGIFNLTNVWSYKINFINILIFIQTVFTS